MAKLAVTEVDVASVHRWIAEHPAIAHVRARKRADLLILESGSPDHAVPHTRLRRVSARLWTVEVPHRGRWRPTGVRAPRDVILEQLAENSSWMLTPLD